MKPRFNILNGIRVYRSKNPYGPETTNTTTSYRVRDVVSGITSSVGDRKRPLPHSYEVVYARFLNGEVKNVNTTDPGYYSSFTGDLITYGNSVDEYFPLELFPANTYNEALSRCYNTLRGTVDLSVDLAQLGQTARMIKEIGSLETYTKMFRSLNALINGVSAARLTYVYGIKPTVSTIYDCLDKVQQALNEDLLVIKERAQSPVSFAREMNLAPWMASAYQDPIHLITSKGDAHKCEIKLRYKPLNNALGTWTSLNPVSIAWELLPYSFVADWLFDIGSYIRNLETALLYRNQFVDGYVSKLSYIDYEMKNKNSSYIVGEGTGRNLCTYTARSTCKRVRFSRSVLTSAPTPEMPSFKVDLGSARLLNAAALLGVLLKHERRGAW